MAGKLESDASRIESELDRIGLLMQHDKALPSATTIIAGGPIAGSWWGHPKGKRIYEVLEELAGGPLALCVKLVSGKRTYVHPRLWSPFLVHGSGPNRSDHRRRLYINGYVRARDCDRGEWAFRNGEPTPFGPEPALVHYEALRERGEPHYT